MALRLASSPFRRLGQAGYGLRPGLRLPAKAGLKVTDMNAGGFALSHRGGGANTAPDETLPAILYGLARGTRFVDAGDWWKSTDAGCNIMHDSTVDRTTTGTGASTTFSEAAHQALVVDCSSGAWFGSTAFADSHPPSLEQVVGACRDAGVICSPEFKTTSDATWQNAMLDRITATGIDKASVLVFSAQRADGPTVAAKGYTFGTFPAGSTSAATLIAANVSVAAYDATDGTVTSTVVQAWNAAGLRVHTFTLDRRTDLAVQTAKGVIDAVHSNEPLYITGRNTLRTADQFSTQTWDDGMIPATAARGVWRGSSRFGFNGSGATLLGFISRSAEYSQIDFTLTYETVPDTGRFAYLAMGTDDALFNDGGGAGNGLLLTCRPDGRLQIFRRTGGTSVQLGSTATTTAITAGGNCRLRYTRSGNTVTLTRLDGTGGTTTATDTGSRGGYLHFGVNDTSASGIQGSLSALTVA